jgi:L-ascorbate metabolism protein UlaG (beta-lactamase superfamily)
MKQKTECTQNDNNYRISLTAFLSVLICGCSSFKTPDSLPALDSPPDNGVLHARFFGISTVYLSDGESSIMIDGMFTRRSFTQHRKHGFSPDTEAIEMRLKNAGIDKIDALFVGHSHFDHALDAAVTAEKSNAILYGSESTLKLFPNFHQKSEILVGQPYPFGNFSVTAFETQHVPKEPFMQNVEYFLTAVYAKGHKFMCAGKVYSFLVQHGDTDILIIPSSSIHHTDLPVNTQADVVFLSIGLLSKQPDVPKYIANYWDNAVKQTNAKLVIPIHFDDFRKPISADGELTFSSSLADKISLTMGQIDKLADEKNANGKNVKVRFPPTIKPFLLESK